MKAVMMSIKPEWCRLIGDGEKTIEIRKSRPKLSTPFKVYIYCTKDGDTNGYQIFVKPKNANQFKGICTGTVIGEFVCDHIKKVVTYTPGGIEMIDRVATLEACLTIAEISKYAHGKDVYAWYITDLVIYDKPKSLLEFLKPGYKSVECLLDEDELCKYCGPTDYGDQRVFTTPNGPCFCEGAFCETAYEAYLEGEGFRLSRPPQSWCYVERRCDVMNWLYATMEELIDTDWEEELSNLIGGRSKANEEKNL